MRFYVFISNYVIAVVYKPYCHYYTWQLKNLVTSKRIKICLVFILKGQYPMAVRYKSVSQTATSFTPESHIWFLEHSFIESNCHSFPTVTLSVPQCLSYPRVITALHQLSSCIPFVSALCMHSCKSLKLASWEHFHFPWGLSSITLFRVFATPHFFLCC